MTLTLGEFVNIFTIIVVVTMAFAALKFRVSFEKIIEEKFELHEKKIFSHIETELLRHENKELKNDAETERKFTAMLVPIRSDIMRLFARQDRIIELKGLSKEEINKEN